MKRYCYSTLFTIPHLKFTDIEKVSGEELCKLLLIKLNVDDDNNCIFAHQFLNCLCSSADCDYNDK